jgi:hypothetical protein
LSEILCPRNDFELVTNTEPGKEVENIGKEKKGNTIHMQAFKDPGGSQIS